MKMNWKVGKKVFETEEEAKQFAIDLASRGCIGSWSTTYEEVTHRYIFGEDCKTEPV